MNQDRYRRSELLFDFKAQICDIEGHRFFNVIYDISDSHPIGSPPFRERPLV